MVRVDKWLWSVRIFKTRSISTKFCKAGYVKKSDGRVLKASYELRGGETLIVRKNGINFSIKVLKLISKRVSYPLAIECYKDITPEKELQKFESWYINAKGTEYREKGQGRPTKKERREIEIFKGSIPNPLDYDEYDDFIETTSILP